MSEHLELNGDNATPMQVVVPKPLYDELTAVMSQS